MSNCLTRFTLENCIVKLPQTKLKKNNKTKYKNNHVLISFLVCIGHIHSYARLHSACVFQLDTAGRPSKQNYRASRKTFNLSTKAKSNVDYTNCLLVIAAGKFSSQCLVDLLGPNIRQRHV